MITIDFTKLVIKPGFKILDIGCGSGRHTGAAAAFDKVTVLGVDINFDNVVKARERLDFHKAVGETGNGFAGLAVSDINGLPFADNYFDLIICSEVLEHIHAHDRAVIEIIRTLKPGGDLAVSVPRYFPERICWAVSDEYRSASDGHIRIYKKKELTMLLEKSGVKQWAVHFAHSLHTPYWWLKCLSGPNRDDSMPVNLYHRFLVWDMMKQRWFSRSLEHLLNPLLGKSLVIYLRKVKNV